MDDHRLNGVAFALVTVSTQQLQIIGRSRPTLGERDDMVIFQVKRRATLHAFAVTSLPDEPSIALGDIARIAPLALQLDSFQDGVALPDAYGNNAAGDGDDKGDNEKRLHGVFRDKVEQYEHEDKDHRNRRAKALAVLSWCAPNVATDVVLFHGAP